MKKIILLLLAVISFNSFGDDLSAVLPEETSAVDFITLSCEEEEGLVPDKLFFKITSSSVKPVVSAQIQKGNFVTNVTSSRNGVEIKQGAGMYRVTVDKNGAGVASYSIECHCESGNVHTQTRIVGPAFL